MSITMIVRARAEGQPASSLRSLLERRWGFSAKPQIKESRAPRDPLWEPSGPAEGARGQALRMRAHYSPGSFSEKAHASPRHRRGPRPMSTSASASRSR